MEIMVVSCMIVVAVIVAAVMMGKKKKAGPIQIDSLGDSMSSTTEPEFEIVDGHEIFRIYRYKPEMDIKVCPNCETENRPGNHKCFMCDYDI